MTNTAKIQPTHTLRLAFVYIRQSSLRQVERNQESTDRQYALVERAVKLGWPRKKIDVIDEDLGLSGTGSVERPGFTRMTVEVALGHVGIVLGLEASRLARNNADWYRLLDLCSITDTLIGDGDGLYHPAQYNDRLVLGLKGTMSEAESHIIQERLTGGRHNKAARGELRSGLLPVGFIWGEEDGEILFNPDEAITNAIHTVFDRFTKMGSIRKVWLWFRSQGLSFPLQSNKFKGIRWMAPSYTAIQNVLTNPAYAGAYAYGKKHREHFIDEQGQVKKRVRHLPRDQWPVLIQNHHEGFIDWETHETILARIATNKPQKMHQPGGAGAVREGAALLQGIAICGNCGRRLRTRYHGNHSTPGYYCRPGNFVDGSVTNCLNLVGGVQINKAVADAFLTALTPAGLNAAIVAAQKLEDNHDAALAQWRLEVEQKSYVAERAERRYRAVEPENRLVARGLEAELEQSLRELEKAQAELSRRERQQPRSLTSHERQRVQSMGTDLKRVWCSPTTTDRDKKELLRTLVEEVIVVVKRTEFRAQLTMRWHGGAITELDVPLPWSRPSPPCTDEDTIDLIRRLAELYQDETIAGILNHQGRKTARGKRFTANHVGHLRRYRKIPSFKPPSVQPAGEPVTIAEAAKILDVTPSSIRRWLADGFIAGEQITLGAPWRIRITEELRARFVEDVPEGYVPMLEATKILGVSRQTVMQRVKRGEISAVHVRHGKRKGLRIKALTNQPSLFDTSS